MTWLVCENIRTQTNISLYPVCDSSQDWESAKRVLSRTSFMDELRNYNKEDNMTTDRRKSLKRYVEDENMSVDRLRKVSRDDSSASSYRVNALPTLSMSRTS